MSDWTMPRARCICFEPLRLAYAVEDMVTLVCRVYDGGVQFHDGDDELLPGIELLRIGGHPQGLQAVRVHAARDW
ncbi:hypothetical protein D3C73_1279220 [compost metagenome]